MKNKEDRRKDAMERQEEYNKMTPQQKVLKLDLKLGGGLGAKRERKKLAYEIEHTGGIPDNVGSIATPVKEKKKYQKPKKS